MESRASKEPVDAATSDVVDMSDPGDVPVKTRPVIPPLRSQKEIIEDLCDCITKVHHVAAVVRLRSAPGDVRQLTVLDAAMAQLSRLEGEARALSTGAHTQGSVTR